MANKLPNPPYQAPMVDSRGYITQAWAIFIRELFTRVGGAAGTNQADVSSTLNSLQTQITALQGADNDSGQGRAI